jgi:hypothetical protein
MPLADRDRVGVDANVQKICDETTTPIKSVKDFSSMKGILPQTSSLIEAFGMIDAP